MEISKFIGWIWNEYILPRLPKDFMGWVVLILLALVCGVILRILLGTDFVYANGTLGFRPRSKAIRYGTTEYAVYYEETAHDRVDGHEGWQIRNLNGGRDSPSVKREGNTIILQPGTYYVEADADCYRDNYHQLVFRDVTDSEAGEPDDKTAVIRGMSSNDGQLNEWGESASSLKGIVDCSGSQRKYQLWHYVHTPRDRTAALGFAAAKSPKVSARYSQITIIRIQ